MNTLLFIIAYLLVKSKKIFTNYEFLLKPYKSIYLSNYSKPIFPYSVLLRLCIFTNYRNSDIKTVPGNTGNGFIISYFMP